MCVCLCLNAWVGGEAAGWQVVNFPVLRFGGSGLLPPAGGAGTQPLSLDQKAVTGLGFPGPFEMQQECFQGSQPVTAWNSFPLTARLLWGVPGQSIDCTCPSLALLSALSSFCGHP